MKYCQNCGSPINEEDSFCQNCGASVNEERDSNHIYETTVVNKTGIKERNIVLAIILSILTCGIYSIYWQVKINDEMLQLANKEGASGVSVILYSIITCGIYSYFWAYKMGECVDVVSRKQSSMNVVFLILQLFGLGIVNMVIVQNTINENVGNQI